MTEALGQLADAHAGHCVRRAADDLSADGRRAEAWARARFEELARAADEGCIAVEWAQLGPPLHWSPPLPAPGADGLDAMGRTNDAILYGGRVQLTVRGGDEAARLLAKELPSLNSRDYGRGFADIFKAAEYDFYKIDGALFAPAEA